MAEIVGRLADRCEHYCCAVLSLQALSCPLIDCSTKEFLTTVITKHEDAMPPFYCVYLQSEMGTHAIFIAFTT